MPDTIIQLNTTPGGSTAPSPVYPKTVASAVWGTYNGQSRSMQSLLDEISNYNGGGSGTSGSTVTAASITLSTQPKIYITIDGTNNYTLQLPDDCPWDLDAVYAPANHSHGSITDAGIITSDTAAASGQKLVICDGNGYVKRSSLAFGSSQTAFLRNDGQWATPPSGGGGSSTLAGLTDVTLSTLSDGQVLAYSTSSSAWVNAASPSGLPSQSGNSGKFLTTDGSAASWSSPFPAMTSNAGKVLTVNSAATGLEWATRPTITMKTWTA